MICERCGSPTRMQVQAVISAPGNMYHEFTKKNLRDKSVKLLGVLWETAGFICTNPTCQKVTKGYGNYVTNLVEENKFLISKLEELERALANNNKSLALPTTELKPNRPPAFR